MKQEIRDILKQYWGYDEFRSLQEDIICSVISGKDTLALMPTGGGKSITYQVAGLKLEGICVVITPLIALMKDQVEELQKRGIVAEAIYTGMGKEQIESTLNKAIAGKIKFLYVSPERLASEQFRARLKQMHLSMLAVDEAHCISQWGYDFRPSYLRIAEIREAWHLSASSKLVRRMLSVMLNSCMKYSPSFWRSLDILALYLKKIQIDFPSCKNLLKGL